MRIWQKIFTFIIWACALAAIPIIVIGVLLWALVNPDKLRQYTQEVEAEKTYSNNTGVH